MRELIARRSAFVLVKSPNVRQQAARRRLLAVGGVLALATASGTVGALSPRDPADAVGRAHTGPFSYFPTE